MMLLCHCLMISLFHVIYHIPFQKDIVAREEKNSNRNQLYQAHTYRIIHMGRK